MSSNGEEDDMNPFKWGHDLLLETQNELTGYNRKRQQAHVKGVIRDEENRRNEMIFNEQKRDYELDVQASQSAQASRSVTSRRKTIRGDSVGQGFQIQPIEPEKDLLGL